MQVRSLPCHVIRNAKTASRLIDAQSADREASIRRDAVHRWRKAKPGGLTADRAAEVVGVPRSTLYRWRNRPEPGSRRPRRLRRPDWPPALVAAVKELRHDYPMWGKAKLAVILRRQGYTVSESTVGRILKMLVVRARSCPCPSSGTAPPARHGAPPPCQAIAQGPQTHAARRDRPGRYSHPHAPCRAPRRQTVHRLRSGGQMDLCPSLPARHGSQRQALPRQAASRHALPHHCHPGRRRRRVQGRLRERVSAARHRALRVAAPIARTQRTCRAQQRGLALRVLRLLATRHRQPRGHQPMARRFRQRVQHLPAASGPWRTNTRRVPCSPSSQRCPAVSYVLNEDSLLQEDSAVVNLGSGGFRRGSDVPTAG